MFYIFSALYYEAAPIIRKLGLKKNTACSRFQFFTGCKGRVCLTVTGTGAIAAACAVSCVFSEFPPEDTDIMINFGSCAELSGVNDDEHELVYICAKILEYSTGRIFYPDMVYNIPCSEAAIISAPAPDTVTGDGFAGGIREPGYDIDMRQIMPSGSMTLLEDMEAAAFYQAASYFIGPHQMIFLKAVTDNGDSSAVTADDITKVCADAAPVLTCFIENTLSVSGSAENSNGVKGDAPSEPDEPFFENVLSDMHCSAAMRERMNSYLKYFNLAGIDFREYAGCLYDEGVLPCRDKKAGIALMERIKRELVYD